MSFTRRNAMLQAAQAGLLSACGLSERPFVEQRRWPMAVPRSSILPARIGGKTIELRKLRAGPGLEGDELQIVKADGSLALQFYERWSVTPADGVEGCLMLWLNQSGRFSAVLPQGSRAIADITLEGSLTSLHIDLAQRRAEAVIALTAIDLRSPGRKILMQSNFTGKADLINGQPADQVHAQLAALSEVFDQIENAIP